MTNPEHGFYGIAVVLTDGKELEMSGGKLSYPMCHIAITPLLFKHEVSIKEIDLDALSVLVFKRNAKRKDGEIISWRLETCIGLYTNRNKANLKVIGNIEPSYIYDGILDYAPQQDRFFLYGDVNNDLGREAYIAYSGRG